MSMPIYIIFIYDVDEKREFSSLLNNEKSERNRWCAAGGRKECPLFCTLGKGILRLAFDHGRLLLFIWKTGGQNCRKTLYSQKWRVGRCEQNVWNKTDGGAQHRPVWNSEAGGRWIFKVQNNTCMLYLYAVNQLVETRKKREAIYKIERLISTGKSKF